MTQILNRVAIPIYARALLAVLILTAAPALVAEESPDGRPNAVLLEAACETGAVTAKLDFKQNTLELLIADCVCALSPEQLTRKVQAFAQGPTEEQEGFFQWMLVPAEKLSETIYCHPLDVVEALAGEVDPVQDAAQEALDEVE